MKDYFEAFADNFHPINYSWTGKEPAKVNYFFGPGYRDMWEIFKEAFDNFVDTAGDYNEKFGDAEPDDDFSDAPYTWIFRYSFAIARWLTSQLFLWTLGLAVVLVATTIEAVITLTFTLLDYLVFMTVWVADRIYIASHKIHADCPSCHERYGLAEYVCPDCGAVHKALVPNRYGIFFHRCNCGKRLPSTFISGRWKLPSQCPNCHALLVSSEVRPIGLQLVGGTKAGKTVYLAAFYTQFLAEIMKNKSVKFEIEPDYKTAFEDLLLAYLGQNSISATARMDSSMYPLVLDFGKGPKTHFYIYDIAGEMFSMHSDANSREIDQKQFRYCDGILFALDPFSQGNLREERVENNESVSDFADVSAEESVNSLNEYLTRMNFIKTGQKSKIQVSVIVTKCDCPEVYNAIGPEKIMEAYTHRSDKKQPYSEVRDSLIRQFLLNQGISDAVLNLEATFMNVHYYAISAVGHSYEEAGEFSPFGVMEPVEDIFINADKSMGARLFQHTGKGLRASAYPKPTQDEVYGVLAKIYEDSSSSPSPATSPAPAPSPVLDLSPDEDSTADEDSSADEEQNTVPAPTKSRLPSKPISKPKASTSPSPIPTAPKSTSSRKGGALSMAKSLPF